MKHFLYYKKFANQPLRTDNFIKDLVKLLLLINKPDEAIKAFKNTLDIYPNNMTFRELLIQTEKNLINFAQLYKLRFS